MEVCYWAVVPFVGDDGAAGVVRASTAAVPPFMPAAARGGVVSWSLPLPAAKPVEALERSVWLVVGPDCDIPLNMALIRGRRPPLLVWTHRRYAASWVLPAGGVQEVVADIYPCGGDGEFGQVRARWEAGALVELVDTAPVAGGATAGRTVLQDGRVRVWVSLSLSEPVIVDWRAGPGPAAQWQVDARAVPVAPIWSATVAADAGAHESQIWAPVLVEPANVEIGIWSDVARGVGEVGGGALVLANADGAYTFLRDCAIGEIEVRVGSGREASWSEVAPLVRLRGGVADVGMSTSSPSRVTIPVQDGRGLLSQMAGGPAFLGTSTGATGYEGRADLANVLKPWAWGDLTAANVPAVAVNRSAGAWQVHAGAMEAFTGFYLRGGPAGLSDGGNLASAAFDAAAPGAAVRVTDRTRGLIKVGGNPAGALTVDFKGDATGGYVDTVPPIAARVLSRLGVASDRIGASFGAFGLPAKVGLWAGPGGVSGEEALGMLCRSVLGWVVPDESGVWQFGRLVEPAGPPALVIGSDDILSLDPASFAFQAPLGEVTILWGRNYAPMSENDIPDSLKSGAGADPARVEFLTNEWRKSVWRSDTNIARWGEAAERIEVKTALRFKADGDALASLYGLLFGRRRLSFRLVLPMTPALRALSLGQVVGIEYPPAGISGLFTVMRRRLTAPGLAKMTITFWG